MDIKTYIESSGLTREQFASAVGVTNGAISHWLKGRYKISPASAIAVERATNGVVSKQELRPDIFGEQAAA